MLSYICNRTTTETSLGVSTSIIITTEKWYRRSSATTKKALTCGFSGAVGAHGKGGGVGGVWFVMLLGVGEAGNIRGGGIGVVGEGSN